MPNRFQTTWTTYTSDIFDAKQRAKWKWVEQKKNTKKIAPRSKFPMATEPSHTIPLHSVWLQTHTHNTQAKIEK